MVNMQTGHGSPVTLYNTADQEIGTVADPINVEGNLVVTPATSTAIATSQITVSATEVLLLAVSATRDGATISNGIAGASQTIYIGNTGVTTATGFPIPPGSAYNIDSPNYTGAIYGIAVSGQLVGVISLT